MTEFDDKKLEDELIEDEEPDEDVFDDDPDEDDYSKYRYDTQMLIDGTDLDVKAIRRYFRKNFDGNCLMAVGDEEMVKIHYHTNEPWKVLEYCSTLGEIYDIVVEDMFRQSRGLDG